MFLWDSGEYNDSSTIRDQPVSSSCQFSDVGMEGQELDGGIAALQKLFIIGLKPNTSHIHNTLHVVLAFASQ